MHDNPKKCSCNIFGQIWYMIMQFCVLCRQICGHRLEDKALLQAGRKTIKITIQPFTPRHKNQERLQYHLPPIQMRPMKRCIWANTDVIYCFYIVQNLISNTKQKLQYNPDHQYVCRCVQIFIWLIYLPSTIIQYTEVHKPSCHLRIIIFIFPSLFNDSF